MLYDLFICHASEDKDSFVRPLAEELTKQNVEVWYDEFSLKLGDSIRQSIDKGLKQSRFGIIVLSKAFFNKNWTQYELDGLNEREMAGNDKVILPIWHNITHAEVLDYSPSFAGRKAVLSSKGIDVVVSEIFNVIHPQGSPLIEARDIMIEWGLKPPVITDRYWLDVVEASNRTPAFGMMVPDDAIWGRWSFPLVDKSDDPKVWGERLAETAMQMNWVSTAESVPISPLTKPEIVLEFINKHPGLYETCEMFPRLTAEYAPQLTIPGFGGDFEELLEEEYQKSIIKYTNATSGTAITIDGKPPVCSEEWCLRHESFGGYLPDIVASEYFTGGMFGPRVSPYDRNDHLFWLLSKQSDWLTPNIHEYLQTGMIESRSWLWDSLSNRAEFSWSSYKKFPELLYESARGKKYKLNAQAKDDLLNMINLSIHTLDLPETKTTLYNKFIDLKIAETWIENEKKRIQMIDQNKK